MTKHAHRNRLLALAVVAALALPACGRSSKPGASPTTATSTTTSTTVTPPSTASTAPPTTTTTARPARTGFSVYLVKGDRLAVARRSVAFTTMPATAAVRALLAGPSAFERSTGLTSAVPAGTALRSVSIAGGTATVDLTSAYVSGGGSLSMTLRLAQVTYTLTQFSSVQRVAFRLNGRPATVFGGEGIMLDHPATRADFAAVAPA